MKESSLLKVGVIGTLVTAICCFTPVLVIALGAVGLGGLIVWLDVVLLPALAVFIAILAYALYRHWRG